MLSIESFVSDFRRTAENRIPAELLEPRLREIRCHLEASAKECGEIEAVRRFGRPQQLANEMVRSHRGYEKGSPASLSRVVCTGLYTSIVLPNVWIALPLNQMIWIPLTAKIGQMAFVVALGCFLLRAFVTRRWIALPAVGYCAAALFSIFGLRIALSNCWPNAFPPIAPDQNFVNHVLLTLWRTMPSFTVILFGLNALALGLGILHDRRRMRHA